MEMLGLLVFIAGVLSVVLGAIAFLEDAPDMWGLIPLGAFLMLLGGVVMEANPVRPAQARNDAVDSLRDARHMLKETKRERELDAKLEEVIVTLNGLEFDKPKRDEE